MTTSKKRIIIAANAGVAACGSRFATSNTLAEKVSELWLSAASIQR